MTRFRLLLPRMPEAMAIAQLARFAIGQRPRQQSRLLRRRPRALDERKPPHPVNPHRISLSLGELRRQVVNDDDDRLHAVTWSAVRRVVSVLFAHGDLCRRDVADMLTPPVGGRILGRES